MPGTPSPARCLDLTDEDFDLMMTINTKSALYGMQAIVPYFKEHGTGHLINISSALGRIPFASYRSAYSASKAALNSLTANLRMDLRATYPNIHISVVMPPDSQFGLRQERYLWHTRFHPAASALALPPKPPNRPPLPLSN